MVNTPPDDLVDAARRIYDGTTKGADVELTVHNMLQYQLMHESFLREHQIDPGLNKFDAHKHWMDRNSALYRNTFELYKVPIVRKVLETGQVPDITSLPHHMYFID